MIVRRPDIASISIFCSSLFYKALVVCILLAGQFSICFAVISSPSVSEFEPIQSYPINGSSPRQLVLSDFDNNGSQDIAILQLASITILLNDNAGAGTYPTIQSFNLPTNLTPTSIAVADIDGGNNMDLIVSLQDQMNAVPNSRVAVYSGNGDGTFQEVAMLTAVSNPGGIAAADFDDDGIADFAVVNSSATNNSFAAITLFVTTRGQGQGGDSNLTFTTSQIAANGNSENLYSADMDGDTIADLVSDSEVYINNGAGVFSAQAELDGRGLIALGRLDNDNLLDIVQLNSNRGSSTDIVIQLMNSNGSLLTLQTLQDANADYRDINIADVNQDGRGDIIVVDRSDSSVKVFLQDCTGKFPSQPFIMPDNGAESLLASSLLDNNNAVDIVALSHNNNGNNVSASVWLQIPAPVRAGTIQFCNDQIAVNEAAGTVDVEINRVNGANGPISINYTAQGFGVLAPAEPGIDFNDLSAGNLVFQDGDIAAKKIQFQIINDILFESDETFEIKMTADRGAVSTPSAFVDIINDDVNQPPQVDTGVDQTVIAGSSITLDGSASFDPDGRMIASHQWLQLLPNGNVVTFTPASNIAKVSFVAPSVTVSTLLTFELTVTDYDGASASATVAVTVNPAMNPPTAAAGPDQLVTAGDQVNLDGSASTAFAGGSLVSYAWTSSSHPNLLISLDPSTPSLASFIAPVPLTNSDVISIILTVTDNAGVTATDTVLITVNPQSANLPPVADAGANQAVFEGTRVTLDGTASSDSDGDVVSYAWTQVAGAMTVSLSGPTNGITEFTADSVLVDTTLTFQLQVTDNQGAMARATVDVTITAVNQMPSADAGGDQTVETLLKVDLDGGASTDSDGNIVSYLWEQTAGTNVDLNGANSVAASFVSPDVAQTEILRFTLTVTDNEGGVASDIVDISVLTESLPANKPAEEKTGAFDPVVLLLMVLLGVYRLRWRHVANALD